MRRTQKANDERLSRNREVTIADRRAFNAGFQYGLAYAQTKLDAYATYVAGKITLAELEKVINQ